MAVFKDVQGLRHWRRSLEGTVALVPTMGNLHKGHLALVRLAAQRAEHVLVSIYVNPLQFGRNEDLNAYPRTLEADLALLHEAGVSAVFVPDDTIMYPRGRQDLTVVMPSLSLSRELCGRSRPGHFAGVCTVVSKLFHICGPELAVFGEKDWQQLRVVARMVDDLDFPVQVLSVPTQRETDGLACSSRNRHLNPEERRIAPLLYRTLEDLAQRSAQGHNDTGNLRQAAWEGLDLAGFIPEYLELRDAETLREPSGGALRWFAAARLGKTRLIDNVPVPPVNP